MHFPAFFSDSETFSEILQNRKEIDEIVWKTFESLGFILDSAPSATAERPKCHKFWKLHCFCHIWWEIRSAQKCRRNEFVPPSDSPVSELSSALWTNFLRRTRARAFRGILQNIQRWSASCLLSESSFLRYYRRTFRWFCWLLATFVGRFSLFEVPRRFQVLFSFWAFSSMFSFVMSKMKSRKIGIFIFGWWFNAYDIPMIQI